MAGGGDFQRVRDGWIAFEYLRSAPALHYAAAKAASVGPTKDAYDLESWRHPSETALVPLTQHDPGALLDWARRHTYFPMFRRPGMAVAVELSASVGLRRLATESAVAIAVSHHIWTRRGFQGVQRRRVS
jgi:hypothetical protein